MASKAKPGFFFKDWVEFYGRRRLCEELKITKWTTDKWAAGKGYPEVKHMRVIRKLSKGVVDYHHMIEGNPIPAPRI